jgi:NTP pyrophosphatase (non-canonical NTP hydrolase)
MKPNVAHSRNDRPEAAAAYIAELTGELVQLARSNQLSALAYLLDLARLEALERTTPPAERSS